MPPFPPLAEKPEATGDGAVARLLMQLGAECEALVAENRHLREKLTTLSHNLQSAPLSCDGLVAGSTLKAPRRGESPQSSDGLPRHGQRPLLSPADGAKAPCLSACADIGCLVSGKDDLDDSVLDAPPVFDRAISTTCFVSRSEWQVDDREVRRVRRLAAGTVVVGEYTSSNGDPTSPTSQEEVQMTSFSSFKLTPEERKRQRPWWVVHPQSVKRACWDIFGLLLICFDTVTVPLEFFEPTPSVFSELMAWISALFWTLDIGASFCTGLNVNGKLIFSPREIRRRYQRTWLPFDIMINLPDWLILVAEDTFSFLASLSIVRGVRAFRFLRLLRAVKLEKVMGSIQQRINSNYTLLVAGLVRLMLGLLLWVHVTACIWYGIGRSTENGWANEAGFSDSEFGHRYLVSLQWSLLRFHGEENIIPRNSLELAFDTALLFVTLALFSSFLSSVTSLTMQLQSLSREKVRRLQSLHNYLRNRNISQQLSVRVKVCVQEKTILRRPQENDVELLNLLTPGLRAELHSEARGPVLDAHPFFAYQGTETPRLMWRLNHELISEICAQAGEMIFTTGDACTRMLFIDFGHFNYVFMMHKALGMSESKECGRELLAPPATEAESMQVGSKEWLSEAALWMTWEHCGELSVVLDGCLLSLEALAFATLVREYERAFVWTALYARAFVEAMNLNPSFCSDYIRDSSHSVHFTEAARKSFSTKAKSKSSVSPGPS